MTQTTEPNASGINQPRRTISRRGTIDEFGVLQTIEFETVVIPEQTPGARARIAAANSRANRRRELAEARHREVNDAAEWAKSTRRGSNNAKRQKGMLGTNATSGTERCPYCVGLTPSQYRRRHKLQKLPMRFSMPEGQLPIASGRVTFIRQVTSYGKINLLGLDFLVGKRLKHAYVKATIDTQRRQLTVYLNGRIAKRFLYPYLQN
jgi:hypothetical protein